MLVKVIRKFRDKYTGDHYKKGDILEITEERYAEIMTVGELVLQIAQKPAAGAENDATINPSTEEQNVAETPSDGFDVMSVKELKEYADKAYKLTFKSGTKKAEIIEELRRLERNGR